MNTILSPYSASVSELKKNPSSILEESGGEPVAILNHNRPTAYLVSAAMYEEMLELLENADLLDIVQSRSDEKEDSIHVSLDEL